MLTVAVTGDVGAGKSHLVNIWASLGAGVIDADSAAKSQWSKPEVLERAVGRWGDGILRDGTADFREISRRAFSDEEEYRFMNSLIHPGTVADICRAAASLRGLVVLEIPLLFESGAFDWADYIVYVSAPDAQRILRNAARGWGAEEIARRECFMARRDEKMAKSNAVLANDGDIDRWEAASRELGMKLMAMATVHEFSVCCATREDAQRLAALLVENRLAACVNIWAVESRYLWKGGIHDEPEWHMSCKATARSLRPAMECVRANHPYELPAITAVELSRSDPATLEWIVDCCGA
ncbi:MAG: dephospho-CoA kinase [Synergistaceae bacterium]|jgi:dephospho-CoA kinase|nr:dephospho-CoA kinase [Synergistaceae bacterium]